MRWNFEFIVIFFTILGITGSGAADTSAEPVLLEDFETTPPVGLGAKLLKRPNLSRVEGEGVGGSFALKTAYVGYEQGSKRHVLLYTLPERGTEYTLNYDVKFAEDFQFVRGGKLHGLGPDSPIAGGKEMRPDGWSARVVFTGNEEVRTYLYCQNKKGKYGVSRRGKDFKLERGKYYAISLHVRLNDPDKDNGFAHIYINGDQIIQHDKVQFRGIGGDNTLISKFLFSTFHGGHTPECAPRDKNGNYTTVHAYFDNIAVYPGKRIRPSPGE